MVQSLQPATLKVSSYCTLGRRHGASDRTLKGRGSVLYHDARKSTEHDLDLADLVLTAFGAVGIGQANRNSLDCRRELSELHPKLASDVVAIVVFHLNAEHANVRRRRYRVRPVTRQLHGTRQRRWERGSLGGHL
jgi:hypothetical protein